MYRFPTSYNYRKLLRMDRYADSYTRSIQDRSAFWLEQAATLDWYEQPPTGVSQEGDFYRWFTGGKLNTSYLALDYHVEHGRADQYALIYDSPVTGQIQRFTYRELRDQVAQFAGVLQAKGLQKGDTAIIYMPMIPQAAIAMLACARLGVIHSVVFGGFAAHELAIRIDDAKPKVLIAATGGIEIKRQIAYMPIIDAALEEATHDVDQCIIYQRPQVEGDLIDGRDYDWDTLMASADPVAPVSLDATDPLYILYTSGTTGTPKGIVRDNGGHATALKFSMQYVYGVDPGDVFWAASDVGWVVGHSYIVYGPLLHGCTTIMFEGKPIKTPDPGTFWRVIDQHKVKVLFTAPTAIRAIKKEDPNGLFRQTYPMQTLKYLFLAGERCDVATYEWATQLLKVPVIDHWWQTESGWPMLANMVGLQQMPIKPGSAGKPVHGYDIQVLDVEGNQASPNQEGILAIKLPLAPGTLMTIWGNDTRFRNGYLERFPGYYLAGDGAIKDEDGYLYITGRIDDVINVAGHRLSTAEMEEVVAAHEAVAECAVIGIADALKGQVPVGFVVLKGGVSTDPAALEKELVQMVRQKVGPVASFKRAVIATRLPKTRSGKILRRTMRAIADGKTYNMPSTIEDPAVLGEIASLMETQRMGIAFQ
ncbi:MAG: propionyl-CoA synthetase [Bacteroidota bacterium]